MLVSSFALLDHLVGDGKKSGWERQTKSSGSLQVDGQFELCRLHDRQIAGLFAFEDFPRIDAFLAIGLGDASP